MTGKKHTAPTEQSRCQPAKQKNKSPLNTKYQKDKKIGDSVSAADGDIDQGKANPPEESRVRESDTISSEGR